MNLPYFRRPQSPPGFYNDLLCRSGFGDRITDLWGALTVCRLLDPSMANHVHWLKDGNQFKGFKGDYSLDLFEIEGCEFIDRLPRNAVKFKKSKFSARREPDQCVVPLGPNQIQVILRSCFEWGNSYPDRLHRDASYYGLPQSVTLKEIVKVYRKVGRMTRPAALVAQAIPDDIEERVGIHVRRTDKLVEVENAIEMSYATWERIEQEGYRQIDVCIENNEPMFVCSDDISYRGELVKLIRDRGGDVIVADISDENMGLNGYPALVDFFALTRCRRILQMTKYSTFSIAAAIAGGIPFENLHPKHADIASTVSCWQSVLT